MSDVKKPVRLEIRLTETQSNELKACSVYHGVSQGEILRRGLVKVFKLTELEKGMDTSMVVKSDEVRDAMEHRHNRIYEEAYKVAYENEYSKMYVKCISSDEYTPHEADEEAKLWATIVGEESAELAVQKFWKTKK